MTTNKYPITYYHSTEVDSIASHIIGHFSIRFDEDNDIELSLDYSKEKREGEANNIINEAKDITKIYGKSVNDPRTKSDNISYDQRRIYEAKQKNDEKLISITQYYYDKEKYEQAKQYVQGLADTTKEISHSNYNILKDNCVSFANEIHQMVGGKGTLGMLFTEDEYRIMNSEAGWQMKKRFGVKGDFKVLTPRYNQEAQIAKDYNIPIKNVRYDGIVLNQDNFFHTQNSYTIISPNSDEKNPKKEFVQEKIYIIENVQTVEKYIGFVNRFNIEYSNLHLNYSEDGSIALADDPDTKKVSDILDKHLNELQKLEQDNLTVAQQNIGDYVKAFLINVKNEHSKGADSIAGNKNTSSFYNEIRRFANDLKENEEYLDKCLESIESEVKDIIDTLDKSRRNLHESKKLNVASEEDSKKYWEELYKAGEEVIKPVYAIMFEMCSRYKEESNREECRDNLSQKEYKSLAVSEYGITNTCDIAHYELKDLAESFRGDDSLCTTHKDQYSLFNKHLENLEELGLNRVEIAPVTIQLLGLNYIADNFSNIPLSEFPKAMDNLDNFMNGAESNIYYSEDL